MFELHEALHARRTARPSRAVAFDSRPSRHADDDSAVSRRSAVAAAGLTMHNCLAAMLDQVDHPMILVAADQTVIHANRSAQVELRRDGDGACNDAHPLVWHGASLMARAHDDAVALAQAIQGALARGLRKLVALGSQPASRVSVAVMAVGAQGRTGDAPGTDAAGQGSVLLVMGKRRVGGDLSLYWFARHHGLTQTEASVLQALCNGQGPNEIAREHGVAISTVRTQLAAIRAKTGAPTLRCLVNEVACLPPLVHALGAAEAH